MSFGPYKKSKSFLIHAVFSVALKTNLPKQIPGFPAWVVQGDWLHPSSIQQWHWTAAVESHKSSVFLYPTGMKSFGPMKKN